jgi:hypothetical protein
MGGQGNQMRPLQLWYRTSDPVTDSDVWIMFWNRLGDTIQAISHLIVDG